MKCYALLLLTVATAAIVTISPANKTLADSIAPPQAEGKAVMDYLNRADFRQWALLPGTQPFRQGKQPHGALQNVYVNDIALRGLQTQGPLPDGSMIVKEIFSGAREFSGLAIMYKTAAPPNINGYFWMTADPDGRVLREGALEGCMRCHTPARARDYIMLRQMP